MAGIQSVVTARQFSRSLSMSEENRRCLHLFARRCHDVGKAGQAGFAATLCAQGIEDKVIWCAAMCNSTGHVSSASCQQMSGILGDVDSVMAWHDMSLCCMIIHASEA